MTKACRGEIRSSDCSSRGPSLAVTPFVSYRPILPIETSCENICFEKIECLNGLVCRRGVREAITNQGLALRMRVSCPDLGLEMGFCNRAMSWVFVFFPRRIALDPAHAELCMVKASYNIACELRRYESESPPPKMLD